MITLTVKDGYIYVTGPPGDLRPLTAQLDTVPTKRKPSVLPDGQKQYRYLKTFAICTAINDFLYPITKWSYTGGYSLSFMQESWKYMPQVKHTMWGHQETAYKYAFDKPSVMIPLGMGFGKSKVAIDLIHNKLYTRTLIVCPKRVVQVWPEQFETHHLGKHHVLELGTGSVKARARELEIGLYNHEEIVAIVNYESLLNTNMMKVLTSTHWDCIIADESHRIKTPGSKVSKAMYKLVPHSDYRICLTGTPMGQGPLDIYGQYRFLDVGIFGSNFANFKGQYADYIQISGSNGMWPKLDKYKNLEEFNQKYFSIALNTEGMTLDLPPVQHIERKCDLHKDVAKEYKQLEREFYTEFQGAEVLPANALVKMLRLQEITSGYIKGEDETTSHDKIPCSKLDLLQEILEDIDTDEPIIIFCRFRKDLKNTAAVAAKVGRSVGELSGRCDDLQAFRDGDVDTLVVQMQSGNAGIDLTRARYGIYYSVDSSLLNYEQSEKRIHRPGQDREVIYLHLVTAGTIDEKIARALINKRQVINEVLGIGGNDGSERGEATY